MRTFQYGVNQPTNFAPSSEGPLDIRLVVDLQEDLINFYIWEFVGLPRYEGQIVAVVNDPVEENNGVYSLRKFDSKDFIGGQGWIKLNNDPLAISCYVDNISIMGEGTLTDPFHVVLVDGGQF